MLRKVMAPEASNPKGLKWGAGSSALPKPTQSTFMALRPASTLDMSVCYEAKYDR